MSPSPSKVAARFSKTATEPMPQVFQRAGTFRELDRYAKKIADPAAREQVLHMILELDKAFFRAFNSGQ